MQLAVYTQTCKAVVKVTVMHVADTKTPFIDKFEKRPGYMLLCYSYTTSFTLASSIDITSDPIACQGHDYSYRKSYNLAVYCYQASQDPWQASV